MADKIVLNTPRYKGEYDFDLEAEPLTALEWRWVKKISGYLPLTIQDGWEGGDPDLFVAFGVVALARAGRIQKTEALSVADVLSDSPFDGTAISFVGETTEDEEDPPLPAPEPATETPNANTGSSLSQTSDSQGNGLSRTGVLA